MFGFSKVLQSAGIQNSVEHSLLTFLSGFTFTIFAFAFQPFFLNVLNQDAQTLAIVFTLIGIVVSNANFAVEPLTKRFNLADVLAIAGRAAVFLLIPTFPVLPAFIV